MKIQILILLLFLSANLTFAFEADFVELTLPEDSLKVRGVASYGDIVIASTSNDIFRSTNAGKDWEHVFHTHSFIAKLYAKDPHTLFITGSGGLVYRSMDYGKSWFNVTAMGGALLMDIACKDYDDCLAMTRMRYVYHTSNQGKDWKAYDAELKVRLNALEYINGKYSFGGEQIVTKDYYHAGDRFIEYSLPLFSYKNDSISTYDMASTINNELELFSIFNFDNIFISLVYKYNWEYFYIIPKSNLIDPYIYDLYASVYNGEEVIDIQPYKENAILFTINGKIFSEDKDTVKLLSETYKRIYPELDEITNDISKVNSVSKSKENMFYIASNNSKIYKMTLSEPITNLEENRIDKDSFIRQKGNELIVSNEVESFKIYNYMGQIVNNNKLKDKNAIQLKQGIYFIKYKVMGRTYSNKILISQ